MTPAERVAGAMCLLSRHRGAPTATHPVRCRFCSVDLPELEQMVHADDGAMTMFMQLPERRRKELVAAAAELPIASWLDGL